MMNFKDKKADIKLTYKKADGLDLPIHIFLPDTDIHNAQTILFVHGGGWNDAIKNNQPWNGGWMCSNAKYAANKGYIGIVISYRSLMVSESLNVGHLLRDCIDAITYIKEHIKFVNFDNIVYAGDSAGGYLVTMLGLSQNDDVRPKTVISLNPVLGALDSKWKYGFNNCSDIKSLTPKYNIGEKCADFLFMHGTADEIVEIKYTEELNDLLLANGHKSEFIKVKDAKHAFALYDYQSSDEFATEIMEKMIDFIKKSN